MVEEKPFKIVVVDDNIANLKLIKNALGADYDVFTAPSSKVMFDLLTRHIPDLILLDVDMPEMNGYEAIQILKAKTETREIPVVFLTQLDDVDNEIKGLELGAVDYIVKPFLPPLLRKHVEAHLTVENQKKQLKIQTQKLVASQLELQTINSDLHKAVEQKTRDMLMLQRALMSTMADLVESRDHFTGGHIERTQGGLRILIEALRDIGLYQDIMADWDMDQILRASQLHDVGKIAIRDSILLKPGRLTPEEFEEMKKHTTFGVDIISKVEKNIGKSPFLTHAKIFAATHHEKWDGTGYPKGLRGEETPLQGRIMAIADVYDALSSYRPYKEPMSHDDAAKIILEGRGTHFDPVLVDLFKETESQFRKLGD